MTPRVLSVGVDGSAPATSACAWAAGLAEHIGASLRVLQVWQTPPVCAYPAAPSAEEAIEHARAVVREALETTGITRNVESVVVRGAAGPSLVDGSSDTDLLVVGRAGGDLVDYKPLFGELLGASAARYCAHHAAIPVAAVNEGAAWIDSPQVVVGIDGSPASLEALQWATRELPASATIHAVRAVPLPDAERGTPIDYELLDPAVAEHREQLQLDVESSIDETFRASGRSVQDHVVLGYAQDGLIDPGFAYDLIVVGAHGDTGVQPAGLGSVADRTLTDATVPIVIVPAPA